jgi:L-alanine-DL-glutamate epimerase-like enolase superfamily enzyme
VQLSLNAPNTIIQETVRAFNNTWYQEIVNNLPDIRDGYAYATQEIGCGTNLSNSFINSKETITKTSSL